MGKFIIHKEIERFGDMRVYSVESEVPNHFVNSGKVFTLDFLFNSTSWLTGAGWFAPRFMGLGDSANSQNGAITGPSGAVGVAIGGDWSGPDDDDFSLANEVTAIRSQVGCLRAGKTSHVYALFQDADFTGGPPMSASQNICEMGIFLSGTVGYPAANPITTPGTENINRNNAMLIRGIDFTTSGTDYVVLYTAKDPGTDLMIEYIFADFEG